MGGTVSRPLQRKQFSPYKADTQRRRKNLTKRKGCRRRQTNRVPWKGRGTHGRKGHDPKPAADKRLYRKKKNLRRKQRKQQILKGEKYIGLQRGREGKCYPGKAAAGSSCRGGEKGWGSDLKKVVGNSSVSQEIQKIKTIKGRNRQLQERVEYSDWLK